nr:ATP synthase F0 subunit 8 [Upeneus nigromarginatus]
MPQLDPSPWFGVFIFSWFVLLALVPAKILAHTFPANPTAQSAKAPETTAWDWSCPQDSSNSL